MEPDVPREPMLGNAFGRALLDWLEHGDDCWWHVVERADGLVESMNQGIHFDQPSVWTEREQPVFDLAGRRGLDVGAGGGRHALPLQEAGHDVVALDVSPGAAEACRRRGVRETFTGTVFDLAAGNGAPFDTFLLCGNNLGLLQSEQAVPELLGALAGSPLPAPGSSARASTRWRPPGRSTWSTTS